MKKLLFCLMASMLCTLQAEFGADQFTSFSFPINQTYGAGVEICEENGYTHFLVKRISYVDKRGERLEYTGVQEAENGILVSNTFTQDFGGILGELTFEYELLCFEQKPDDEQAIDVGEILNLVRMLEEVDDTVVTSPESFVIEVTTFDELQAYLENTEGTIYVDCYSPLCPPCKMLAPKYDEFSVELAASGTFLKVSLNDVPEMGAEYDIDGLPTLLVFKDQREVERKRSLPTIMNYFDTLITSQCTCPVN
ncbi:MAG: hypothetical protein SP1CHLAM54_10300 [Chlamydiia bacterium]|nr:hypothetical protein [Chlamydiia bacterium]MCH9615936.1 hypothetical protein [Chlamydiia bacterium]MCH9628661.1 hypothetical protein [Chlamydiia bacterium]